MHIVFEFTINTINRIIIIIIPSWFLRTNKTFPIFIIKSWIMRQTKSRRHQKSHSVSIIPKELPVNLLFRVPPVGEVKSVSITPVKILIKEMIKFLFLGLLGVVVS